VIATNTTQVLNIQPGLDYVFLLEDLELAMTKEQLNRITKAWNDGMELEEIAAEERRHTVEVLIALIHQAKRKVKLRPFAFRRG
jgi:hypothetical protein